MAEVSCVAGHCVRCPAHASTTVSFTNSTNINMTAYVATPSRIVVAALPTSAPSEGTVTQSPPRVLSLPPRHVITCITTLQNKPLLAVGTQDHGAFVVPTVSDKGVPVGLTPESNTSSSSRPSSRSTSPVNTDPPQMESIFSVSNNFVSGASGSNVITLALLQGPSTCGVLLAMVSTKKSKVPPQPSGVQQSAIHALFVSIWGVEEHNRRVQLWCSDPAAFDPSPTSTTLDRIVAFPASTSFVASLKKELVLWNVLVSSSAPKPTIRDGVPPAVTCDVKQRMCRTVPELKGAQFVAVAVPPQPVNFAASSAPSAPIENPHFYALTTAGFLVCFNRADGRVEKWMDCKVCPATVLACTSTHVIVGGSSVRFFSIDGWVFCGKITADPAPADRVLSTASNYFTTLWKAVCVAVSASPRGAVLFYQNGDMTAYCVAPVQEGATKLQFLPCSSHVGVDAALTTSFLSSTAACNSGVECVDRSLRTDEATLATGGQGVVAQQHRMSPRYTLWTTSGIRLLDSHLRDMNSVSVDLTTTMNIDRFGVVVAFDTMFHGVVAFDKKSLLVRGRLALDFAIDTFVMTASDKEGCSFVGVASEDATHVTFTFFEMTFEGPELRFRRRQCYRLAVAGSALSATGASPCSRLVACCGSGELHMCVGTELYRVKFSDVTLDCGLVIVATFSDAVSRLCASAERLVVCFNRATEVVVVNPSTGKQFPFQTPFAVSNLAIDTHMRYLAVMNHDRTEIAVLSVKDKGAEVDRVSPVCGATAIQALSAPSLGTRPSHMFAAFDFASTSTAADGGSSSSMTALVVCEVNTEGASWMVQVPFSTAVPQSGGVKALASKANRLAPPAAPSAPPSSGDRRRTASCGAPSSIAMSELNQRFEGLDKFIKETNRTTARGYLPPPQPTPPRDDEPVAQRRKDRRQDPLHMSGLLMTPQIDTCEQQAVLVRLGAHRWSDPAANTTAGGGDGKAFDFPNIRSHDSSINSSVNSILGIASSTPPLPQRHVVEPSAMNNLLIKKMKARNDPPLREELAVGQSSQGAGIVPTPSIAAVVESSVDVTDSLARRVLQQERAKLVTLPNVAATLPPNADLEPILSPTSPTKAGDVEELHVKDCDDDDYVVIDSTADGAVITAVMQLMGTKHEGVTFAEGCSEQAKAPSSSEGGPHPEMSKSPPMSRHQEIGERRLTSTTGLDNDNDAGEGDFDVIENAVANVESSISTLQNLLQRRSQATSSLRASERESQRASRVATTLNALLSSFVEAMHLSSEVATGSANTSVFAAPPPRLVETSSDDISQLKQQNATMMGLLVQLHQEQQKLSLQLQRSAQ